MFSYPLSVPFCASSMEYQSRGSAWILHGSRQFRRNYQWAKQLASARQLESHTVLPSLKTSEMDQALFAYHSALSTQHSALINIFIILINNTKHHHRRHHRNHHHHHQCRHRHRKHLSINPTGNVRPIASSYGCYGHLTGCLQNQGAKTAKTSNIITPFY